MNSYELSRKWFDFAFENPEKIKPNHTALYFFTVEHCNRLGWKTKFGLPTTMAKDAIGIRSYNTYINTLNDLVEWGFIDMIERSKNQYSSNIVALSNFDKALDKALDKAMIKHGSKQSESIDSINKPITSKQVNQEQDIPTLEEFIEHALSRRFDVSVKDVTLRYYSWVDNDWCINRKGVNQPIKNWKKTLTNTVKYLEADLVKQQSEATELTELQKWEQAKARREELKKHF